MTEKTDELIDSYAAATTIDAVEIFYRLEGAMCDLRHSVYMGNENMLAINAATARRHARKLIDELLRINYHLGEKQKKANQLKIIK